MLLFWQPYQNSKYLVHQTNELLHKSSELPCEITFPKMLKHSSKNVYYGALFQKRHKFSNIFPEHFQFFQSSYFVDPTQKAYSDLQMFSQSITEKLCCLVFQNLLLIGIQRSSYSKNSKKSEKILSSKDTRCMAITCMFFFNKMFTVLALSFSKIDVTAIKFYSLT